MDLSERTIERIASLVVEQLLQVHCKRFLSREEFAKQLGVSVRTIDRRIEEGKIAVRKEGKRILISMDQLDRASRQ